MNLWQRTLQGPASLKLYAGRTDPADESHFTIDCILGDQPRVLDGWLTGDDHVNLALRAAPAIAPASSRRHAE